MILSELYRFVYDMRGFSRPGSGTVLGLTGVFDLPLRGSVLVYLVVHKSFFQIKIRCLIPGTGGVFGIKGCVWKDLPLWVLPHPCAPLLSILPFRTMMDGFV